MHMLTTGTKDPNPRQQILDDIIGIIKDIPKSDMIFIGIHANETTSDRSSGISKFIKNINLTDTYSHIHNNIEFSTHINGSNRINFLLYSNNLLGFINTTGALDFQEGFDSDHRGLFCDISSDIFTNITEDVIPCTRQIGTNSTNKEGDRYVRL
jgi:hypothetical protein